MNPLNNIMNMKPLNYWNRLITELIPPNQLLPNNTQDPQSTMCSHLGSARSSLPSHLSTPAPLSLFP